MVLFDYKIGSNLSKWDKELFLSLTTQTSAECSTQGPSAEC